MQKQGGLDFFKVKVLSGKFLHTGLMENSNSRGNAEYYYHHYDTQKRSDWKIDECCDENKTKC